MDRFYAVCSDLEMTLTTHTGAQPPGRSILEPDRTQTHLATLDTADWGLRAIYMLVIFGAFERFPNLKLVLTEVPGIYWDSVGTKMDTTYLSPLRRNDTVLSRLPSEYMADQRLAREQLHVPLRSGQRGRDRPGGPVLLGLGLPARGGDVELVG